MGNIEFINQRVESGSFLDKTISKFLAVESEFVDCKFESMKIKDVCFGAGNKQSKYVNCSFDNSVFSSNVPGLARFENCSFRSVKIKRFFCVDIELINCTFSGEIVQGNFVGVHRDIDGTSSTNEFRDNDFTDLKLGDVGFSNIDLAAQTLPVGSDFLVISDLKVFLSNAKVEATKIKDQNLFDSVLNVLNIIELESEDGNNQMFLDKRSFPKKLQDAVSTILAFN